MAYLQYAGLPPGTLDPRSGLIMVYALCGFANFGSVGILIAGMSALMPERRDEIVPLALRAMVSGTLASGLSGLHDRAADIGFSVWGFPVAILRPGFAFCSSACFWQAVLRRRRRSGAKM